MSQVWRRAMARAAIDYHEAMTFIARVAIRHGLVRL